MAISAIRKQSSNDPRWKRDTALALNNLITQNNGERSITNVTASYTLWANDTFLAIDAGVVTITLAEPYEGHRVTIKDTGFNAGMSTITIIGTIDGTANRTITTDGGYYNLIANGVDWFTY